MEHSDVSSETLSKFPKKLMTPTSDVGTEGKVGGATGIVQSVHPQLCRQWGQHMHLSDASSIPRNINFNIDVVPARNGTVRKYSQVFFVKVNVNTGVVPFRSPPSMHLVFVPSTGLVSGRYPTVKVPANLFLACSAVCPKSQTQVDGTKASKRKKCLGTIFDKLQKYSSQT